jgi:hypothetical protein
MLDGDGVPVWRDLPDHPARRISLGGGSARRLRGRLGFAAARQEEQDAGQQI